MLFESDFESKLQLFSSCGKDLYQSWYMLFSYNVHCTLYEKSMYLG